MEGGRDGTRAREGMRQSMKETERLSHTIPPSNVVDMSTAQLSNIISGGPRRPGWLCWNGRWAHREEICYLEFNAIILPTEVPQFGVDMFFKSIPLCFRICNQRHKTQKKGPLLVEQNTGVVFGDTFFLNSCSLLLIISYPCDKH